jgi:O-antigen ligase
VLCLIGTALTYAWFSRHRFVYLGVIFVMAVVTWFALPEQYKGRYGSITDEHVDESAQGRLDAWMAGARMFADHPITGVGPHAFAAAYLDREGVWLYSHSLYVELLATMGVLGSAAWVWFLWQTLASLRRMSRAPTEETDHEKDAKVFARANYAVIVGLLIAGVFGHILFRDTWYVVAALVVARENVAKLNSGVS